MSHLSKSVIIIEAKFDTKPIERISTDEDWLREGKERISDVKKNSHGNVDMKKFRR
jgi:hypothetical protein